MMSLLAINAVEKGALIAIYGVSAVGAVLIVKDVLKEFLKMINNAKTGHHSYEDEDE